MNLFILFLLSFTCEARDLFELTRNSFLNNEEAEFRIRTGAPPVTILKDVRMINSISFLENRVDDLSFEENEKLILKELMWSPIFLFDWNHKWKASWGLSLFHRSEGEILKMNSKTFALSQFINFQLKDKNATGWNWSWGFYFPDRSLQSPVFPGIQFSYLSEDQKWSWQFRGPSIVQSYFINDQWQWSSKFFFRSGSYRIYSDGFLDGRGSYVQTRQTRIETGLKAFLLKPWILSFNLGYQMRGHIQAVNSQGRNHDNLSERAAAYLDFALSYSLF